MKNRPSYDGSLADSPLQRRRYARYTCALGSIWARRIAQRLHLERLDTSAALRATCALTTRAAREQQMPEPAIAASQAENIATVVHRFVTDVTPYSTTVAEKTGGASLREMYADPRYSRAIVIALASLFRPEILATHAVQAA